MYCIDFFRKWKREGNFCGLDATEASRMNSYLELVEMLVENEVPEDVVFANFSLFAARPLLKAGKKKRTKGIRYVTDRLKEGKAVTAHDIQTTLIGAPKKTVPAGTSSGENLEISSKHPGANVGLDPSKSHDDAPRRAAPVQWVTPAPPSGEEKRQREQVLEDHIEALLGMLPSARHRTNVDRIMEDNPRTYPNRASVLTAALDMLAEHISD
jgi:hypothetical protein